MGQRTPLYQKHVDAGAKIVDFAGWDMPLHYGSQIAEHRQVRDHAGVFDVSHMNVVDLDGSEAEAFLRRMLCGDVAKLQPGAALYTLLLNEEGGVIDDLIVYRREGSWRLVANCGTRAKVLAWLRQHAAGKQLALRERADLAILAVNGPAAIATVATLLAPAQAESMHALRPFECAGSDDLFIARTGYTGEDGVELIVPAAAAPQLWDKLVAAGVRPTGLGARDTLRLEAGMNLYGHDMDEKTSPLSANLAWTIAWEPADRDFIGRAAVTRDRALIAEGRLPVLTGLVLETRGVLREGQEVTTDRGKGVITSGSFAPTLNLSIALARVPVHITACTVDLRGTPTPVRIVKPRFVRFGKKVFD
ncbi:MAG TPA: glycine cleavage system aminomethyltransferase GcvT [Pseudomonadales bacterium]